MEEAAAKGSMLSFLRSKIKGSEIEKNFIEKLSSEEKHAYESALAFTWVPIKLIAGIFEKGAPMLYPGEYKASLRNFGKNSIKYDFKGIYRVAMQFASVNFLVERFAKVYSTYYNKGDVTTEKIKPNGMAAVLVKDFPELSTPAIEANVGALEGMLELHNCTNIKVSYQAPAPGDHKWICEWQ